MKGVLVGYARVSTSDQDLTIQDEALAAANCDRVFREKQSGKTADDRAELQRCLAFLRDGDTLVVTRLDRLGRSVKDLLAIIESISTRGIKFRCLQQPIFNTGDDATSKLVFTILAGVAEFELKIRKERQMEGIARARKEGRIGGRAGRNKKFSRAKVQAAASKLVADHGWGASQVARHLQVNIRTLYRYTKGMEPPLWGDFPSNAAANVPKFDLTPDNSENPTTLSAL